MSQTPTFNPPNHPFCGATHARDIGKLDADAVIFAAPHGTSYRGNDGRVFEGAAKAMRKALELESNWLDHYDFDLEDTLYPKGSTFHLGDLGDLTTHPEDGPGNRALIEATARAILETDAVPIMIGGDDSVPIPFIKAFEAHGPLTIVQVDAHIDWRKKRFDEPFGLSSTMRRASEMKHVERIIQVGMRSVGSARTKEVEAAKAWGVEIVTARRVHEEGVAAILKHVPKGAKVLFTIDCDSLDVSIMPAVLAPTPGGLTYLEVIALLEGIRKKATLAGFDMIEFVPERDPAGTAAYVAGRIVRYAIAQLIRQA
ncbi:MAG: arginase family protein [Hyphomicrobiaceae bacterium]